MADPSEPPPSRAADEVTVREWLDLDQPQPQPPLVPDPLPPRKGLWSRIRSALQHKP